MSSAFRHIRGTMLSLALASAAVICGACLLNAELGISVAFASDKGESGGDDHGGTSSEHRASTPATTTAATTNGGSTSTSAPSTASAGAQSQAGAKTAAAVSRDGKSVEGSSEDKQNRREPVSGQAARPPAPATAPLTPAQVATFTTQLAAPPAQNSAPASHGSQPFGNGEVLVVGMDETALSNVRQLGFQVVYQTGDDNGFFPVTRLTVPDGVDTLTAMRTLKVAMPGQVVALNSLYRIYSRASGSEDGAGTAGGTESCTPDNCRPWSLIGWKDYLRGCSKGLAIGMIDTAVDTTHPALANGAANNQIITEDFLLPGKKPASNTHGTGVASLLIGDGGKGMAGLVPDVTLYAANAFYADGGQSVTDTVSLLKALDWMRRHGVRVVNMSFAGPNDPLLAAAIRQSVREGMIIVAAAGNEGADAPEAYPAAYNGVIAVTAVDTNLKPYARANHGEYIKLSAPGVHIWTAGPNGKGAYQSGTSFAAPYVTAVAATLLRASGPETRASDLLKEIKVKDLGGEGKPSPVFGNGLALAPGNCGGMRTAEELPWTNGWSSSGGLGGLLSFTPAGEAAAQ